MLTIWIGYDRREDAAAQVARASILRRASRPVQIKLLRINRLRCHGIYERPTITECGQMHDVISEAPMSTEFAISRFASIILNHQGAGLFVDCDIVCMRDIMELIDLYDPTKAVQVVQHKHEPTESEKMAGLIQTKYPRKNWSSAFLFNSSHAANRALTLKMLNSYPGRMLHRFCWLADEHIGALPGEWNWLVGEQPKPENPGIAHFTKGGPFNPGWTGAEHDEIWLNEMERGDAN